MTWVDEYKRALIRAVVRMGSPVDDKSDFFGWIARDHEKRRAEVDLVGIDFAATPMPDDSEWNEFQGTFYTGDTRHRGIDVMLHLNNGRVMHWRVTTDFAELLKAVLVEAEQERQTVEGVEGVASDPSSRARRERPRRK